MRPSEGGQPSCRRGQAQPGPRSHGRPAGEFNRDERASIEPERIVEAEIETRDHARLVDPAERPNGPL
eukprot:372331-Rhodomonas_salina.4